MITFMSCINSLTHRTMPPIRVILNCLKVFIINVVRQASPPLPSPPLALCYSKRITYLLISFSVFDSCFLGLLAWLVGWLVGNRLKNKKTSCCGSCSVSCSLPFCTNSFTCKGSLQWVIGLVPGLWLLLLHYQFLILARTLLRYTVIALSCGDPATLVL